ncbi:MAG TPA: zinc-binding dehydrogenase, partial [Planctomycetota bacterium]|nr:zinc-binding dehydrogenase [Planctomycetota bacterium]
ELGAAGGFDYREPGWAKRLAAPPALIVDGSGGAGYGTLLQAAARGGRIVSYGATAGPPEKLELSKVFWKQLRLQGSTMGSPADFAAMMAFVERHRIAPAVDGVFPLAEGPRALDRMARSEQFGKIVLETA